MLIGAAVAKQRDVPKGLLLDTSVNVFEAVCGHIPTACLPLTLKRSLTLTDRDGRPLYWDASAFLLAYDQLFEERAFVGERAPDGEDESTLPDCAYCHNERLAEKWFPSLGRGANLPCDRCRPKAFAVAVEQWKERNAAAAPTGSIAQVVEAGRKLMGDNLRCTGCGREVNTYLSTKRRGGACGALLNRYVSDVNDEGEPELCDGILEQVPSAH